MPSALDQDCYARHSKGGWSVNKLAGELKVPAQRINEIVRERRAITADTALRLSQFFGSTPEFWVNLQSFYDLRKAIN